MFPLPPDDAPAGIFAAKTSNSIPPAGATFPDGNEINPRTKSLLLSDIHKLIVVSVISYCSEKNIAIKSRLI